MVTPRRSWLPAEADMARHRRFGSAVRRRPGAMADQRVTKVRDMFRADYELEKVMVCGLPATHADKHAE
jgi:hypothetical protein